MEYSIFLEPVDDPGFEGWFYAHVPALDLTTHGQGVEGATAAAHDLIRLWIDEKRSRGEPVKRESGSYITRIEVPDAAVGS